MEPSLWEKFQYHLSPLQIRPFRDRKRAMMVSNESLVVEIISFRHTVSIPLRGHDLETLQSLTHSFP